MVVPANNGPLFAPDGSASGAVFEKWFSTTQWGTVLAARTGANAAAHAALESLCQTYWYPLYAYVRHTGRDVEEARDLTQEFFARFLERGTFSSADPARGRFRTFLLTAMKHFLANEWKKENRLKRGGGKSALSLDTTDAEGRLIAEPVDQSTPEVMYERRWAATLLEQVLRLLGEECALAGRAAQFEELKASLWGEHQSATQAEIAACPVPPRWPSHNAAAGPSPSTSSRSSQGQ